MEKRGEAKNLEPDGIGPASEGAGTLFLKILPWPEEGDPPPFPVAVRSLTGGGTVLELDPGQKEIDWRSLKGHEGVLYHASPGGRDAPLVRGEVLWVRPQDGRVVWMLDREAASLLGGAVG